jgi:prepilin-type N-terminal cleavage/methylation domain-containing protein
MLIPPPRTEQGFSLVELSIVLVILGLLTGGILTGKSLIRASELRALTTQMEQYRTAIYTFYDEYRAVPGDMRNATDFWGTDPDGCPTHANWETGKTETCNGNGNGVVDTIPEGFHAWQHLAGAGLIEGSYSGVTGPHDAGSCNNQDYEPGYNSPRGRADNVGIALMSPSGGYVASGAVAYLYEGNYTNTLLIGAATVACEPIAKAFSPKETWLIDSKLDDGRPGTGTIVTRTNSAASGHPDCTTGSNTQAAIAQYRLDHLVEKACAMYFRESS